MKLKPKNTVRNQRALHYKRFIGIEKSNTLSVVYRTTDNKYWLFNAEELHFYQLEPELVQEGSRITLISSTDIVQYMGKYFKYNHRWEETSTTEGMTLLSATFNNVAKYQMNKYYYVGSFDFIIKGSIEGSTTQYIKGNIIPLTSLTIKHYNDECNLAQDDLVVIDGHLYSIENPSVDHKHQPKDYKVYFATLNGIL